MNGLASFLRLVRQTGRHNGLPNQAPANQLLLHLEYAAKPRCEKQWQDREPSCLPLNFSLGRSPGNQVRAREATAGTIDSRARSLYKLYGIVYILEKLDAGAFFIPPGKSRRRTYSSWFQCARGAWTNNRKPDVMRYDIFAYRFARARNQAAACHPSAYQSERARMMPPLLLARDLIICWVNVSLVPVEFTFDMIEAELQRRGIDLGIDAGAASSADSIAGP